MKTEVLISCMHEKDFSIIERSNLQNKNALVVNQCETSETQILTNDSNTQRMINTAERGLSRSRNMAIENASGNICVISDNDEFFFDEFDTIVEKTYNEISDADIIIFKIQNINKKLGDKRRRLKKLDLLRVQSQQITFKRETILNKVKFDILLGAGTGNGGGEENKFLIDCYKKGLKIYFEPVEIAKLIPGMPSTWFNGNDYKLFYNWGKTIRYILGFPMAVLYASYILFAKRRMYKADIGFAEEAKALFTGICNNDLRKKNGK